MVDGPLVLSPSKLSATHTRRHLYVSAPPPNVHFNTAALSGTGPVCDEFRPLIPLRPLHNTHQSESSAPDGAEGIIR